MNTVFVTGASGFIGRHAVAELAARDCRIRCLVRRTSSVRHLTKIGAELHCGDVVEPDGLTEAIAGSDVVLHLAGFRFAYKSSDLMRVNTDGTWNVARACAAQNNPPVLVVVSSVAAAGPAPSGMMRTEADPAAPVSNYGRSKRGGELAAEAWADKVPTTILRPGVVFGPWNRETFPIFHSIATLGVHAVPTFAPPPLSLIHVEDLVQLMLQAAENGTRIQMDSLDARPATRPPGYYFASAPEYPNYAQFGRMVARALGRRHVFVWHIAEPLPWILGGIIETIGRLRHRLEALNVDKMREATVPSWASSVQAATEDLGFAPACSLQERLHQTADWYRTRGWL